MHVVAAYLPGSKESVGSMGWIGHNYAEEHGFKPGVIKNIVVDEVHRRKGIGTGMYKKAQEVSKTSKGDIPNPRHNARLTSDGKSWKKSLKQDQPRI